MCRMETNIVFQDSDLELVVSEKTLGSLTTNAKQIRDLVKSALPKYDISNYTDENIDQAKRDKAALNKAAKTLNSKRIEIEREFMKPFGEFKEIVTETVKLIGECSAKIDFVIKQNEQQYKDKKKADIRSYFDRLNKNGIDFNKVFRIEWLNKTVSMKSVCDAIDTIFSVAENDIQALQGFGDDFDVLYTYYKETLDISATIQYANRLKEQRERAKAAEEAILKAEEERKRLEEEKRSTQSHAETLKPETPVQIPHTSPSVHAPSSNATASELLTRVFTVTATRDKIIALGDFMNDNDIDFDKIELADTLCNTDLNTIAMMLEYGASLIDKTATKPCEADKARQFRNMSKKIKKKLKHE